MGVIDDGLRVGDIVDFKPEYIQEYAWFFDYPPHSSRTPKTGWIIVELNYTQARLFHKDYKNRYIGSYQYGRFERDALVLAPQEVELDEFTWE